MNLINYLIFGPVVIALVYSVYIMLWLKKQSAGNDKMREISTAIQEGSAAYLNRQYKSVAIVALPLAVVLYLILGWVTAVGFLIGAVASAIAGYIGMNVAVRSNARTAEMASKGLAPALSLAFKAGSVTGYMVVALGLLSVAGFYFATGDPKSLIGLYFCPSRRRHFH